MPVDSSFVFWVGSLFLSAAAVALFLWLMRQDPRPPSAKTEADREAKEGERDSDEPASKA